MQHRIKNNLQPLPIYCRWNRRAAHECRGSGDLRESVTRIKTIAAAHEFLSADQVGSTDILELARRVAENARLAQAHPGQDIGIFHGALGSVRLGSKAATAFALVVNELVSNSLEHGLASNSGMVEIGIAVDGARAYVVIQDSGTGFPASFDAGLGLRIVRTLIEKDLHGKMSYNNTRRFSRNGSDSGRAYGIFFSGLALLAQTKRNWYEIITHCDCRR